MGGFDQRRPPDPTMMETCVHVGFCLPACPTYLLWGEEMDSPRGRITLMQVAHEEDRITEEMVLHWDRCLGCMACVTACPAGVRYDELIEAVRPQVERHHRRSLSERLLRRLVFALFTHPGRLRALVPLLVAYRGLGVAGVIRPLLPGRLRVLETLAPPVSLEAAVKRLPEHTPPRGSRRARVGLLQGCVQRVFGHRVNEATRRVLAAEGFEVVAPRLPRCCGALMLHSGYEDEALGLARRLVEAFEDCDYVVTNAAGCGSSMKDYGEILRDDPEWAERAEAFSAKVRDVTELLADFEPVAERRPVPMRVAYHDACHLAHAQGIRRQPRELLAAIPGLEVLEPPEWEICCGSAGIYNILQPEPGRDLGERKAHNLLATGAEAIVSANPGCSFQIAAHLERLGEPRPVYHPIELIDRATGGNQ